MALVVGLLAVPAAAEVDEVALATSARVLKDNRLAAGYLRAGNLDLAVVSLERLSAALTGSAHAHYSVDALAALTAGNPARASLLLERLGDKLSEVRRGADKRMFVDCVREIGKVHAPLDTYRRVRPDLTVQTTMVAVSAAVVSAATTIRRCNAEAGPLATDPKFRSTVDGALGALDQTFTALEAGETDQLLQHLYLVRSYVYLLLFLYG